MDPQLARQLHEALCILVSTLRLYWPDDASDNGTSIAASKEARFGPFTGGQVVLVSVDRVVRITTSKDPRTDELAAANPTAVPASAPTYQVGVHVYRIRPGPARFLFVHNTDAANAVVVNVIRGDTDTGVK